MPWPSKLVCVFLSASDVLAEGTKGAKLGSRKEEDGSSGSSHGAGRLILAAPTEEPAKILGGLHLIFLLCKPLKC